MDLWKAMVEINLRGFLLVNGRLMTGVPLAILWILETLLLLVIPLYRVALNARKPYVEGKGCWLTEEEEIVITYVQDYRTMRRALLKQEYSGLSALDYHVLEGQESHGVLTFYRRRDYTGPYITLANVKAYRLVPKDSAPFCADRPSGGHWRGDGGGVICAVTCPHDGGGVEG